MNGQEYREFWSFDANLKIGDIVEARFTNSFNFYAFKAMITKLNNNTLRVRSLENNKPYPDQDPDHEYIINRFFNPKWSANNGVFQWRIE